MVSNQSTTAPATVRYGTAAEARLRAAALVAIKPRFWRLRDVARHLGVPAKTLRWDIHCGRLPVIALPSAAESPAWTAVAVPDVWLRNGRWHGMAKRDGVALTPVYTARTALAAPGDAQTVRVAQAALAIGVHETHVYDLIRAGKFCAVGQDSGAGRMLIHTADLDAWCYDLIHAAEVAWYAGAAAAVEAAAAGQERAS